MHRSERLLALLQILRRYRQPVSGATLAGELGISLRTLYRDIATLQTQGADIEGEAGIGYVLKPGYMLPPLMFSKEEIEALILGFRFVARRTDESLALAARDAMAKINAVLPDEIRRDMEDVGLLVGPGMALPPHRVEPGLFRQALKAERPLTIRYRDESQALSERTVWPFAMTYFDGARVLGAWCLLRQDFRHFRTDRIEDAVMAGERYPRRRSALLREWRRLNGLVDMTLQ